MNNTTKQSLLWRGEQAARLVHRAVVPLQHRQDSQPKRPLQEMQPSAIFSPSTIAFDTGEATASSASFPLLRQTSRQRSGSPTAQRFSLGRASSEANLRAGSPSGSINNSGLLRRPQHPRQSASQLRVDGTDNNMRVLPIRRVVMRPSSHAIAQDAYGLKKGPTTDQAAELKQQKQHLQLELESKKRRIEELLLSERQLTKTIEMLRDEMQVRSRSERYLEQVPANLEHTNEQLAHYRLEVDKLMNENIRLKKELLIRRPEAQQEERELKLPQGSLANLSAIEEQHTLQTTPASQTSIADNPLLKESVVQSIDRIRESIVQLNSLKEKQIQLLKSNLNRYDYLQVEATYQTAYYHICSQTENLKQRLVVELRQIQHKREGHSDKRLSRERRSDALRKQLAQLKSYVEREDESKKRFLEDLNRANELNKTVYKTNEDLKAEVSRLRGLLMESQKATMSSSTEAVNREELQQLKVDNDKLREQMDLMKVEQEVLHRYQPTNHPQLKEKEQQVVVLQQQLENLRAELQSLRNESSSHLSKADQLSRTVANLQQQLRDKERYSEQLEASLAPMKPKKPFILNRSLEQRELQQRQEVQRLERINAELQQELKAIHRSPPHKEQSSTRQTVLKEFNQELQVKLANLQKQYSSQKEVYQANLSARNKRIQELELQCSQNDMQRHDHLTTYQREMSRMLSLTGEAEARLQKELSQKLSQQHAKNEAEKSEYLEVIRQLSEQLQRNDEQSQQRQRELLSKDIQSEKEISRLTAENQALKESLESQLEKLGKANSQHSKLLIEKYQRDLLALNKANQQLLAENKTIASLHLHNTALTTAVKQLQTQVRQRSTVVDHLWEIKKVEYDNVQKHLQQLKAGLHSPRSP